MKGKNHIITGIASVVILDTGVKLIKPEFHEAIMSLPAFGSIISEESEMNVYLGYVLTFAVCSVLFLLGLLLPDVDQDNSTLGRFIHIPVEHRTWTHAIWGVILLSIGAIFVPWLAWLALGCTLHIFWDSISKGGVCWFYPISKYKKWASGAQVKKDHWVYLYRTGETSEKVVAAIVAILGIAAAVYNIILTFSFLP